MSSHRTPPKPKHYSTAPKGHCRYCGKGIFKGEKLNMRASWHEHCLKEYKLIYWPKETRKAVWRRDRGTCASCGTKCHIKNWDLDHRQPLIEAKGRIEFWKMDNLATLCKPCHKEKTSREATARAAARRELKETKAARPTPKKRSKPPLV
jgi:5-methylcytosine-specific restriction endonuclease McrA